MIINFRYSFIYSSVSGNKYEYGYALYDIIFKTTSRILSALDLCSRGRFCRKRGVTVEKRAWPTRRGRIILFVFATPASRHLILTIYPFRYSLTHSLATDDATQYESTRTVTLHRQLILRIPCKHITIYREERNNERERER